MFHTSQNKTSTFKMTSSTILFFLFSTSLLFTMANSATFTVINKCSYTVWAAANPGGGKQLASGQSWVVQVPAGTTGGRVWGRTGCKFDSNGNGKCQTGDCNGTLACTGYGSPPNTLAEFSLNQVQGMDFIDISLVDGFNVPVDFLPVSNGCTQSIHCDVDINAKCPSQLKTTSGCLNPCQVYKTNEYCCTSGSCRPTTYSKFFKNLCPNAYSYPLDGENTTFTCKGGTNYQVIFCPRVLLQAQLVYCSFISI